MFLKISIFSKFPKEEKLRQTASILKDSGSFG
jgi:hypothetical protein